MNLITLKQALRGLRASKTRTILTIVGIVIGTYSSIYVAGALALSMGLTRQDLIPAPKQALDDRP